jgi:ribosomal protein S18 acetylase RimI-like enzyme
LGVHGVSEIVGAGLSPDDVGARVSVRRQVGGEVGDVVGDLESLDADQLAIRRTGGDLALVATRDVTAARVVGPSPLAARELEAVSGRLWPATESEWLGQWCLRAAAGFTARANSVRPLGDPGVDLDDALARVVAWYGQRGLPALIRSVSGSGLDRELTRRGWTSDRETLMQTTTVAKARRLLTGARPGNAGDVTMESEPSASWLRRFRDGSPTPAALAVLTGIPVVAFASVGDGGEHPAAAIGRCAVEGPWAGLAAIEVAPGARRRGLAHAVTGALLDWAHGRGAMRVHLEVMANNPAALALYASLGFAEHHRYTYREPR